MFLFSDIRSDSWNCLEPSLKAVVLKNNFERYIELTGMLTGFQAFVMTMDTLEKTDYLPVFFMSVSFLGNIIVCLVSVITQTNIVSGLYKPCFDRINVACMVVLGFTNTLYFLSIMWSSHITFIESEMEVQNIYMYMQFAMYFFGGLLALLTGIYHLNCETSKRNIPCEERTCFLKKIHQI